MTSGNQRHDLKSPALSTLHRHLETVLFERFRISPASLGIYRILFSLYLLLILSPGFGQATRFQEIAGFPDAFFYPPFGPMRLFSGFPDAYFFQGLLLATHVSAVALLIGYKTKWASIATSILLFTGFGFLYSLGKINHNVLILLMPLAGGMAHWGARYSWDAARGKTDAARVHAWPVALMALCLGFAMFGAGTAKLVSGWLDLSTHAVQGHLYRSYFLDGRQDFLATFFLNVPHPAFWEALDYATVFLEMGFLAACWHPQRLRHFIGLAVFFHCGVMLMFNIAFTSSLVVYALFVDWSRLGPHGPASRDGRRSLPEPAVAALVLGAGLLSFLAGSPINRVAGGASFTSEVTYTDVVLMSGALLAALASGARAVRRRLTAPSVPAKKTVPTP